MNGTDELPPTRAQLRIRASDGGFDEPKTRGEANRAEAAYRRGFQQALSMLVDHFKVGDPVVVEAYESASKLRFAFREVPGFMHVVRDRVNKRLGLKAE